MTLGERIKYLRKNSGLTLDKLGDKIGITASSLSTIENGKNNPSEQTIRAIIRELGCDELWLRTGAGEPFRQKTRGDNMGGIEDRIRIIVDSKYNKNKSAFARDLNITPAFAAQLYSGLRSPSERTISDICRVCCVDELWLRTGAGEPFRQKTRGDNMGGIGERIKYLRKNSGLTLDKLGDRIGISAQSVSRLENDVNNPSEQTIRAIIRELGCDELWLRTGAGEPFRQKTRREQIDEYIGQLSEGKRSDLEQLLIEVMAETTVEEWQALAAFLRKVAEKYNASGK